MVLFMIDEKPVSPILFFIIAAGDWHFHISNHYRMAQWNSPKRYPEGHITSNW